MKYNLASLICLLCLDRFISVATVFSAQSLHLFFTRQLNKICLISWMTSISVKLAGKKPSFEQHLFDTEERATDILI